MWMANIYIYPEKKKKKRNVEIYLKYIIGVEILDLARGYYLSDKSIRRIISQQKKIMLANNT